MVVLELIVWEEYWFSRVFVSLNDYKTYGHNMLYLAMNYRVDNTLFLINPVFIMQITGKSFVWSSVTNYRCTA